MLHLKSFQPKVEASRLAVAVGATLAGVAFWRLYENSKAKQAKWKRIHDLRQREVTFRSELKQRLQNDAKKHAEICELSFEELIAKLQTGSLKSIDVLEAYQWNALLATEKTNCVTEFMRDAEQRAKALDAAAAKGQPKLPLHGLPVSLKETYIVEGTEATGGLTALLGRNTNAGTAQVVQFLIDQGAIPFCKTNLPQAIMSLDSRNPIYGMTTHPFDSKRTPGGSSSGEASLLALHGSILGMGSDIGGSVRLPAAWCGLCGLKPTWQRMATYRGGAIEGCPLLLPPDFGTFCFMSRDVNSLAEVHRLFYSETTFKNIPDLVPVEFRDSIYNDKKPLTIGYYYNLRDTVEAVESMKRGVRLAKEALEKLGHRLVEFNPPDPHLALMLELQALFADGGVDAGELMMADVEISYPNKLLMIAALPTPFKKLYTWWNKNYLGKLPIDCYNAMSPGKIPHDLNLIWRRIKAYREEFLTAMRDAKIDLLIGPPCASPAVHSDDPRDIFGSIIYTCLYNVLNWPSGSVPICKVSKEDEEAMKTYPEIDLNHRVIKRSMSSASVGLPVGVQVSARPYCEEMVLRVMRELEANIPQNN